MRLCECVCGGAVCPPLAICVWIGEQVQNKYSVLMDSCLQHTSRQHRYCAYRLCIDHSHVFVYRSLHVCVDFVRCARCVRTPRIQYETDWKIFSFACYFTVNFVSTSTGRREFCAVERLENDQFVCVFLFFSFFRRCVIYHLFLFSEQYFFSKMAA